MVEWAVGNNTHQPANTRLDSIMTVAYPIAGIDVAKHSLDLAVLDADQNCASSSLASDEDALKKLAQRLLAKGVRLVVLEATGGLEVAVMLALEAKGIAVARINPQRVRDFAKGLGWLAKTDRIDARLLAIYGERMRPMPTPLTNEKHRLIKELVARRKQLVDARSKEKTRSHQCCNDFVRRSIAELISHFDAQIAKVESAIDELVDNEPVMAKKRKIMLSFCGVGAQSANAILAYLPELGVIGHKKASALVGVAPFSNDSATRLGKRRTAGGRTELRQMLYIAVQTGYRYNPRLKPLYLRLRDRGRTHKCALIACLNKMIKLLTAMLKTETPFMAQNQEV